MTVGELIAQLQKLPLDLPVKIEGYTSYAPDSGRPFIPIHIGLRNETRPFGVIWAATEAASANAD